MKKSAYRKTIALIFSVVLIIICSTGCSKKENAIKFPQGSFPDTVITLASINSPFDDYNSSLLYQLAGSTPIIFSSNRNSSGGQFDLVQANIAFTFDQTNGAFQQVASITTDPFLDKLINKAITPGNDFGPYRFYSPIDGYEYLLLSSVNSLGNLDLVYLRNRPVNGSILPDVEGPFPIKLLNTSFDDGYLCLDTNLDTLTSTYSVYFTSNRNGNFDIFQEKRPSQKDFASWFNLDFKASAVVDSVNSSSDDKCPFVYKKVMVFTSNRPGGLGGYDLYYSILRNGKWSSPINFGPGINSSSDEYRPVIGNLTDFTNSYLIFSSNRPGGKGGYDLYFTGVDFPK